MKKIFVIYGSCGHGHQRAAEYVAEELRTQTDADIKVFDFLDYTIGLCKVLYPFGYKFMVSHMRWLWALSFHATNIKCIAPFIQWIRRIYNHMNGAQLERFLRDEQPDVIVLTHFFPAEAASSLKKKGLLKATIVTIVTDSIAHVTWINTGSDYFIGFSEDTKQGLVDRGIPADRIFPLGIPIAAKFDVWHKKEEFRAKYGLDEHRFTILLTSGSFGVGPMEEVLDILDDYAQDVQVFVVCGNNEKLYHTLKGRIFNVPMKVFGFVDFMDELMEAADLIIAKSGGLTTCESLAKEVPMVISKPIPGQEAYNAHFLVSNNAAFRIRVPADIRSIISSILQHRGKLDEKRANIAKIKKPHATRDIVGFLKGLLE